jgi:hypothetical protein
MNEWRRTAPSWKQSLNVAMFAGVIGVAGCGVERYEQRLDETRKLYEHENILNHYSQTIRTATATRCPSTTTRPTTSERSRVSVGRATTGVLEH